MKKRYIWRELTPTGLLIKPEGNGPYYSRDNWDEYGHITVEDAEKEFIEMEKAYPYQIPQNMKLIEVYRTGEEDGW